MSRRQATNALFASVVHLLMCGDAFEVSKGTGFEVAEVVVARGVQQNCSLARWIRERGEMVEVERSWGVAVH